MVHTMSYGSNIASAMVVAVTKIGQVQEYKAGCYMGLRLERKCGISVALYVLPPDLAVSKIAGTVTCDG